MGLGFRSLIAVLLMMLSFGATPTASGASAPPSSTVDLGLAAYRAAACETGVRPAMKSAPFDLEQPAIEDLDLHDDAPTHEYAESASLGGDAPLPPRASAPPASWRFAIASAGRAAISSGAPRGPPARA